MPIRTMPASDLRKALHGVINSLDQPLLITTRGRVKAVLIDIERYNQMIDDLQDLEDARNPEIRQAAEEAREARREDLVPLEEVLKRYGL